MADYISCVEASGGNSERIATEVTNAKTGNTGVGVKGSASGLVAKGSGSVTVDRATEQALASKFEQTWTSKGMEECRKVLDSPKSPTQESKATTQKASPPKLPALPGGTGWIFAGYFNIEKGNFIEGPYVSVQETTTRGLRRYVEIGDTIGLKVASEVYIVDFAKTGTDKNLVSPTTKEETVDKSDKVGITLPAGTELVVRDISEGNSPRNPNAALWLRVVYLPK